MNLIFLGPPGSGKGTQSVFLKDKLGIPAISTGNILREACEKQSPLGIKTKSFLDSGKLVPDEVIIPIVEQRLQESDCKSGYILDGFPRTVVQAEVLLKTLADKGQKVDAVINFDVNDVELVARLTGRRMCRKCGRGYHIQFSPPQKNLVCDACGGELYQRDDDKKETIEKRLEVYKTQTAPLIDYFKSKGLLKNIAAVGEAKEISKRITTAIGIE